MSAARYLLLTAVLIMAAPARLAAGASAELEVVSWAPGSGPQALWYDSLEGLRTAAAMFNAHGGLSGRRLSLVTFDGGERDPDFMRRLAALTERPGVVAIAGGPAEMKAGEIAEYFRRAGRPWLGPWSQNDGLYQGRKSDPFALLPTWREEMPALLGYLRLYFDRNPHKVGPVCLIYYDTPPDRQMAEEAKEAAGRLGLDLKKAVLKTDFNDWDYLAKRVAGAAAYVVRLPQGPAAAFVREAKKAMPDQVYMTSALNATNRNLALISGGAWNGVIFPSVLTPSRDIPAAYQELIKKYGVTGLTDSYHTLLGLAQGQVLARGLSLGAVSGPDLPRGLYGMKGFSTILSAPIDYEPGRHRSSKSFYLARAYGDGHWEAVPAP